MIYTPEWSLQEQKPMLMGGEALPGMSERHEEPSA